MATRLLTLKEVDHLQRLQDEMMAYAERNELGRMSLQKILAVLYCTCAIANGAGAVDVLSEINWEFQYGAASYTEFLTRRDERKDNEGNQGGGGTV